MIRYKINICDALKKAGHTSYSLHQQRKLSYSTWAKLNKGGLVSLEAIGKICHLLHKQPGDLIEFVNG